MKKDPAASADPRMSRSWNLRERSSAAGAELRKSRKAQSLSRGAEGSNPAPPSRESEISSAHTDNRVPQR